jgi:hypothetical protein
MNLISTMGLIILQFSHPPKSIHSQPNHSLYEFPPVERMIQDFGDV